MTIIEIIFLLYIYNNLFMLIIMKKKFVKFDTVICSYYFE